MFFPLSPCPAIGGGMLRTCVLLPARALPGSDHWHSCVTLAAAARVIGSTGFVSGRSNQRGHSSSESAFKFVSARAAFKLPVSRRNGLPGRAGEPAREEKRIITMADTHVTVTSTRLDYSHDVSVLLIVCLSTPPLSVSRRAPFDDPKPRQL